MMKKTFKTIISAIISLACLSSLAIINVSADTDIDSAVMYGDATCNNEVDIRDITAVNQHIVKTKLLSTQGIKNCDFYGTGNVTIKDIGQMKKYAINIIDKLEPVKESEEAFTPKAGIIKTDAEYSGSKVYTSAEEFRADISVNVLELEGSDEQFFEKNNIYVGHFTAKSIADNSVESVDVDENGNFIINIISKISEEVEVTGRGEMGYSAVMTIPKSVYNNQTVTINVKEVYEESSYTYNEDFSMTDYGAYTGDAEQAVCTTYQELCDYVNKTYADSMPWLEEAFITDIQNKYNEEFFEDNVVFVKRYGTDGGQMQPIFNNVEINDDEVILRMINDYSVEDVADLNSCFVSFSMKKSAYKGQEFVIGATNIEGTFTNYEAETFFNDIEGFYAKDESLLEPKVFTSYDEFSEYINNFTVMVYPIDGTGCVSNVDEILTKYNEEFFENNVLFINAIQTTSNDYSVEVQKGTVSQDKDGNFILYATVWQTLAGDQMMGGGFAGFTIPKSDYNNQTFSMEVYHRVLPGVMPDPVVVESAEMYGFVSVKCEYIEGSDMAAIEPTQQAYTSPDDLPDYPELARYDEEFFENNVLYLTYEYLPSGSITPVGKSVETDENGNFILNVYDKSPLIRTCDVGGSYVGFALSKSKYNGQILADVAHHDAYYENTEDYLNSSDVDTDIEFVSPDTVNTDDYVNVYSAEGVYNTEIITDAESMAEYIDASSDEGAKLLAKYNAEFFENNNVSIAKWNSDPAQFDYIKTNGVLESENFFGYSGFLNVEIGRTYMDCVGNKEYCAVIAFPKSYIDSENNYPFIVNVSFKDEVVDYQ